MRALEFLKCVTLLGIYFSMYKFYYSWSHSNPNEFTTSAPSIHEGEQRDWQKVAGSRNLFIVYSAYALVNHPIKDEVVIIGVTRSFTNETVKCRFYSSQLDKQERIARNERTTEESLIHYDVPGNIITMQEHRRLPYAGVFIVCPLPPGKPDMVSVILSTKTKSSNELQIQYKSEPATGPESHKYNYTFSVCVHPIYHYNNVFRLIEWIEFYKLMGVEQFTLYNVSIGSASSCILNDLKDGSDPSIKMNIYPWHNVPITNPELIRGRCPKCALSAGSNDCLYRHRGRLSKYMVFVDLDEHIMPRQNKAENYSQMIDLLESQNPNKNISHYLFKNGFMFLSRSDDPLLRKRCSELNGDAWKYQVCLKSYFMRKGLRDDYHPFHMRTKYIIKPEGVREAGTHWALKLEKGYTGLKVSPDIAYSRHYRNLIPGLESKHVHVERVPDEFGLRLVKNVAKKLKYFNKICKFGLVPPPVSNS